MRALKTFQASAGLKADGVLGRITFGALRMAFKLTPIQLAHFLGQLHHESGGFSRTEENLRYSAAGLLATFPRHYTPDLAKKHEFKPSVIANHVYGGRMGNKELNDGWHFRGRGLVQLTGRSNYEAFAKWAKDPQILETPDLVAGKYAWASAVWFFETNKLFDLCTDISAATILAVSRGVNLGNPRSRLTPNGLEDRIKQTTFYARFIT